MNFKDQWRFVRSNMKRSKSRIFMTVLATAMGVTFLIVLASVGFGLHSTLIADILQDRSVTQMQISGIENDDGYAPITDEEIAELEKIDGMNAVTRQQRLRQTPRFSIDDYNGSTETVVTHFPSELKAGMELAEGDLPEKSYEVVVGPHFIENIFPKDLPADAEIYDKEGMLNEDYKYDESLVGKEIEMVVEQNVDNEIKEHTITLTITGIVEPPAKNWLQDQQVYISEEVLADVEAFTETSRGAVISEDQPTSGEEVEGYDNVYGYADSLEEIQAIMDDLTEKDYMVYSAASELESLNSVFTIAKAGLIFIGTIAILIASIGIFNTMTMAVTERSSDIGIMKAIGAHPKKIKQIFLLESSYIGLLGAVIGTVVAFVISILLNIGLPRIIESAFGQELPEGFQFSSIPPSLILISVVICLIVTIISGLKPAKRATEIDVLKAMRREM
ncbi:acetoin utilization transport system permease protein [Gracilibacillus orientalis]|uniref:Acetoin utilization transport system permease protein n=1 Tax=Gracilibacillus orientalis TaxID=334253 RepID=A0A1I4PPS1_9BACI|nr:FtsX-like permease family protein [Gracilibacillus orientalis]SFM29586.1 acetoin utilization transport system permease protein [Gracilibacillus orientalis]